MYQSQLRKEALAMTAPTALAQAETLADALLGKEETG